MSYTEDLPEWTIVLLSYVKVRFSVFYPKILTNRFLKYVRPLFIDIDVFERNQNYIKDKYKLSIKNVHEIDRDRTIRKKISKHMK